MKKTAGLLLICFICLFFLSGIKNIVQKDSTETNLSIIPAPFRVEQKNGVFTIDSKTRVIVSSAEKTTQDVALYLASMFRSATGLILEINESFNEKIPKNSIFNYFDFNFKRSTNVLDVWYFRRKDIFKTSPFLPFYNFSLFYPLKISYGSQH